MPEDLESTYIQLCSMLGNARLLAVSKHHSVVEIAKLYRLGQRLFGENYVQEAVGKISQLPSDIEWHFIGQLQSNKTKSVAQHFNWVQTIDRLKIAKRLNEHCCELNKVLQVCIYVNIDDEPQKGGVSVADLDELVQHVITYSHLQLRGLMVIPRPRDTDQQRLDVFYRVKQLFDDLNMRGLHLDTLSMGMSNDYHVALAAGATMLRIGELLFGLRP